MTNQQFRKIKNFTTYIGIALMVFIGIMNYFIHNWLAGVVFPILVGMWIFLENQTSKLVSSFRELCHQCLDGWKESEKLVLKLRAKIY